MKRVDLFKTIHKALRAMFYDMAIRIQNTDFTNQQELDKLISDLNYLLKLLDSHSHHEDDCIFPLVKEADLDVLKEVESEHELYNHKIFELRAFIEKLENAIDYTDRNNYQNELNHLFTDFLAFTLLHLIKEERIIMPYLIENYGDEELINVRVKIQSNVDKDEYAYWMKWMLPNISYSELTEMLEEVKKSAPDFVYQSMLNMSKGFLKSDYVI